jgi:hypothetical protein
MPDECSEESVRRRRSDPLFWYRTVGDRVMFGPRLAEAVNRRAIGATAALAGLSLVAWTGWGAYVNRTTERVPYTGIGGVGDVEFREYPETIVVATRAENESVAFRRLFEYLGGANRNSKQVSMTAPVATDGERLDVGDATSDEAAGEANGETNSETESEDVSMTAPVRTDRDGEGVRMEFVLPAEYTPETAPRPTDPRVELVIRPSRTIAVLGFSGSARDRKAKEIESKLLETLAEEGIEAIDEPTLLQYNDPYTPPFMRRNEVAVEVVADDAAAAVGDRS